MRISEAILSHVKLIVERYCSDITGHGFASLLKITRKNLRTHPKIGGGQSVGACQYNVVHEAISHESRTPATVHGSGGFNGGKGKVA
jgi:hypothetical protein